MKKIFFAIIVLLNMCFCSFGQEQKKFDVILKTNGDEMEGKVTEIVDDAVKFIYKGEAIVYNVKKSEILKIKFASGRIEFFTKAEAKKEPASGSSAQGGGPLEHHNKVGIMPFTYLIDKQNAADEVREKVQSECFTILKNHAGGLTIVDPTTTNAMLIKAGVSPERMKGFTPEEICNIIGVEYLVMGTVNQDRAGVTNYQNNSFNSKSNNNSGWRGSSSSSSSSTVSYQTSMTLNIYTDKGENIFSKDHKAFFNTNDAYKITLNYLLKRCPIYRK